MGSRWRAKEWCRREGARKTVCLPFIGLQCSWISCQDSMRVNNSWHTSDFLHWRNEGSWLWKWSLCPVAHTSLSSFFYLPHCLAFPGICSFLRIITLYLRSMVKPEMSQSQSVFVWRCSGGVHRPGSDQISTWMILENKFLVNHPETSAESLFKARLPFWHFYLMEVRGPSAFIV